MTPATVLAQLRDGIQAAKSGDKAKARSLLALVTQQDPTNELGWLWSASVSDEPRMTYECLSKVLELNPNNDRAKTGLKQIRPRAGVAYAKAGNLEAARKVLSEALCDDANNELALLWLSGLTNSPLQAASLLERVLKVNPLNEHAKAGLARLRKKAAQTQLWACPLCQQTNPSKPDHCPTCGAVIDLDLIDQMLDNPNADQKKIGQGVRRLVGQPHSSVDANTSLNLAVGYMNLGLLAEAIPHLRDALQLAPDKVTRQARQVALDHIVERHREAAEQERQGARKLILVVDDSPTIRKVVSATLVGTGHQVETAASAVEAIETLRKTARPDLIFLDINMPGMDGYQFCKLLRQTTETAKVPIIMLSGRDGFFSKIRGRFAGSTDYITKPFKASDLLRAVAQYCGVLPDMEEASATASARAAARLQEAIP